MSEMNLTVTAMLADKLSAPAKRVADALERINRISSRLTGANGLDRPLRGIARGLQAVDKATPSTASIDRTTRLISACRGLADRSAGIANAGRSLHTLARGLSAAGKAADGADKAATALTKLRGAMGAMPSGESAVSRMNAELRENLALQRQATAAATRTTRVGAGRVGLGQRGAKTPGVMNFAAGYVGTGIASRAAHDLFDAGVSREHALTMLRLKGMADKQRETLVAEAEQLTKNDPSRTLGENLNLLNSVLTGVGGDVEKAVQIAPVLANAATILRYAGGKENTAEQVNEIIYDITRAGELQNLVNRPAEMKDFISSIVAANVATGGHIDAKNWHSNLKYSRGANLGWSDDFIEHGFPYIMQELAGGNGGGPAGVALRAFYRAIPLATQKNENADLWRKIGMLDESRVDSNGKMGAGAIKDSELAKSNPVEFFFETMRNMKAAGVTDPSKQREMLSQMYGTATSAGAALMVSASQDRYENFKRSVDEVANSQQALNIINKTSEQSVVKLQASFTDLTATVYGVLSPAFMAFANDLSGASRVLNGKGSGGDAVGAVGVGMLGSAGVIGAAGAIAATVAGGAALAATLPAAAIAAAAGGAIIGGKVLWDRFHPADAGQPSIAGKRAGGGPVRAGSSYLVGENGPEVFSPGSDGSIIPNGGMRGYASLGSGANYGSQIVSLAREQLIVLLDLDNTLNGKGGVGGGIVKASYGGGDGGSAGVSGVMRSIGSSARGVIGPVKPWLGGSKPFAGKGGASPANMAAAMAAVEAQLLAEGVAPEHAHYAAAALVGNAGQEGLNPNAVHDSGTGYGIYGARLGRRDRMLAWLKSNGYARNSLEGQSRYMAHEAMTDGSYRQTREALMAAHAGNLDEVTRAVMRNFESPSHNPAIARLDNRMRYAHQAAGSNKPAAQVPEALRDHERRRQQDRGSYSASNGLGGHTFNVVVNNSIHPQPHHDETKIAEAVHRKFNAAIASQLNDGFMG